MQVNTLRELIQLLDKVPLLLKGQRELLDQHVLPRMTSLDQLLKEMNRREWLTGYQIRKIRRGKGERLYLGRYVILDKIGSGGMGVVYKARRTHRSRIVALKCLRREMMVRPVVLERFRREMEVGTRLSHPNVVRIYEAGLLGGSPYFVMEYLPGVTFHKMVCDNGPLPIGQACELIRQAALALQHAHDHGLVHRDVKPSNLLAVESDQTDQVKLLDLGLARLVEAEEDDESRITEEGTVVGSIDFIAPEQARNARNVDVRADVYSLGCTLYYLLTGLPPFPGGSAMQKIIRHTVEPVPIVKHVGPEVQDLLQTMMAKDPDQRYPNLKLVLNVLDWLLEDPIRLTQSVATLHESTMPVIHLCIPG